VHDANAAPSSAHWKLTPDLLSEKLKLAEVCVVGFAGLAVIEGCGTEG
jgi:hypothetical protein